MDHRKKRLKQLAAELAVMAGYATEELNPSNFKDLMDACESCLNQMRDLKPPRAS